MAFLKCIFFVCLTVLLTVKCDYRSKNRNLIAVVQLFRHGQRTPVVFYRNDPYSDKSFWDGLEVGELTNEGKRQHFALGQFTRNRYGDWLSDKYDKDDFYAYTTDVDRTHMSGQSNLNGLYPAKGDQRWKLFSDWQAIPLHPADGVIFNAIPDASCTNYYIQYANALAAEKYQQINENNADLYDYLSRHSGNNITSVSEASTIFDCFRSENDVHLRLPLWATSVFPDPLYKLTGFTFEQYSYTTQLQRLAVGPFFDNMVKYFEGLIQNSTSAQKYLMYSGHDSNIAAMLNSFDAFNPPYPPAFASSIYIELRSGPGLYYINVWSKNNDDFKPISVRGCTLNCPLSEFKERMKDIIIDVNTRNSECNPNGIENRNSFFTDSNAQEIYSDLVADNGIEKLIARF